MNRADLQTRFVSRFHFGDAPRPCAESALDAIEETLNTILPASYREFMLCHGGVFTPDILHEIVERRLDHTDLQNIFSPAEAIDGTTAYWSGGMPEDLIGIASDCMGNMIGFKRTPQTGTRPSDLPVWFFDHDFIEVYMIANGFDDFLSWYLMHLKVDAAS